MTGDALREVETYNFGRESGREFPECGTLAVDQGLSEDARHIQGVVKLMVVLLRRMIGNKIDRCVL